MYRALPWQCAAAAVEQGLSTLPHPIHPERDPLAPVLPAGRKRAVALAILAHGALIGALTWGVHWKTSSDAAAVEAELWAALPQQAAPPAQAPPPPPALPAPAPPPPAPAPPAPPAPAPRQTQTEPDHADIAIEQKRRAEEKKRRQLEEQKKAEQEKNRREKAERDKAEKDKAAKEKATKERLEKEKAERAAREKAAEEKHKAAQEAQRAEELRQEQLRRIQGLAVTSGSEKSSGTDTRDAGPSAGYGGKVAAKVKPNIVYPDTVTGNPRAEVEVRAAPDGTIVAVRLTKTSGNRAWDDAVLRALAKTETLPRDVDGRVPSSLVIGFRPKD